MSSENAEPIPVPPPATDAVEHTPSATTAAVASEQEATPATTATAPEPTPAPVADGAAKAEEPNPAEPSVVAEEVKKEDDEPQNALTKKFTDAEWAAVKELRAQLPGVFEKAYPDTHPAPSSITLWGVKLSAAAPSAKASVILVKFLRARSLVVADAADMLAATLKWRAEIDIDAIMQEEFDQDVFGRLGKVYGKDKEGRPIAWNLYGEVKDMKAVFGDTQKFIRWRVQFMEQSISFLDFETIDQMVQIHDYEGVSITQRDAAQKAAAKEATTIFQNHYPEFLSRKFFINVPTLLTWIFWLFKPLISAATLAKMSVVGTGANTIGPELSVVIDVKELPKRYGGEAEDF